MENKHLQEISEIRRMMEQSSRFLSLSGMSGIFVGLIALAGSVTAFFYLDYHQRYFNAVKFYQNIGAEDYRNTILFLIADGFIMITAALFAAWFFTSRKARKMGLPLWDNTAKRLLKSLFIPLVAGGIFVLILLYHQLVYLVAPVTLIFYGLALLNASKYTYNDLQMLSYAQICLGLIASFFLGYGLVFWAVGFGIFHILYGIMMYYKYEK